MISFQVETGKLIQVSWMLQAGVSLRGVSPDCFSGTCFLQGGNWGTNATTILTTVDTKLSIGGWKFDPFKLDSSDAMMLFVRVTEAWVTWLELKGLLRPTKGWAHQGTIEADSQVRYLHSKTPRYGSGSNPTTWGPEIPSFSCSVSSSDTRFTAVFLIPKTQLAPIHGDILGKSKVSFISFET